MDSVSKIILLARQHYQAGRLAKAENLYRQILQQQPQQLESLSILGMLAYKQGKLLPACTYYQKLVNLEPDNADYHNNLGIVFKKLGKLDDAITHYREALGIKPKEAQFHHNLAKAWVEKGDDKQGIKHFRRAIALQSNYAKAYISLGNLYQQQGNFDEAISCLETALTLKPSSYKLHNDLSVIFKEQGKNAAALSYIKKAVSLHPKSAQLRNNLGTNLLNQGLLDEAKIEFLEAIALKPSLVPAYLNLGNVLIKQGAINSGIHYLQKALQLDPNSAQAHNQLGIAYKEQDQVPEAIKHYRQGITLEPKSFIIHNNLGNALRELAQFEESTKHYQCAIALNPNYSEAHSGIALNLLIAGDLEAGFAEYEWRWQTSRVTSRSFTEPIWDGSSLAGRRILLHGEQGFGDSIQFIRYVSLVARLGGYVIVEVPQPLLNLFETVEGIDTLVKKGTDLPQFDCHAPLMSLPRIFATSLATIPQNIPYLSTSKNLDLELNHDCACKVGIVWAGNPHNPTDKQRSCSLKHFLDLLQIPDVAFYSLQKGEGVKELASSNNSQIKDLSPYLQDFADTAAIIQQLDLIITVDTAVAHLAGAMGKPVWLLLSYVPDWRWMLDREDSPWYLTMRLFRQSQRGDWHQIFLQVIQALRDELKQQQAQQLESSKQCQQLLQQAVEYYNTKRRDLATEICQEILRFFPRNVDALNLLGIMAYQGKQWEEAAIYYQQVIAIQPDNAHAHNNLGILLKNQGQTAEAIKYYQQALEIQPKSPEFHHNLGVALKEQGNLATALEHCQRAITYNPQYGKANLSVGTILLEQGDLTNACTYLQQAIALIPKSTEAYHQLALAYKRQGDFTSAISCYQAALKIKPNQPKTYNNLANAFIAQGNWDGALPYLQQAIALKPNYDIAYHNLGKLWIEKAQWQSATQCFQQAIKLNPHHAEAHFGLAFTQLITGNLESGFAEYEWRKQLPNFDSTSFSQPVWDGSNLEGKTILLHGEQGFGDTIQFIRYAPMLRDRGAKVIVGCHPSLLRLFSSLSGIDQLVVPGDNLPAFDVHAPLLSLPHLFHTTIATIPNQIPYLPYQETLSPSLFPRSHELKIGLVWAGNPNNERDSQRSCPLKHFLRLKAISGIKLYSLQKGQPALTLDQVDNSGIIDLSPYIEDFADTAALINQLDLVITVDTVVAHLAGAMGKSVWVLLSSVADWRWLLDREDSPWYPTMGLFRQSQLGDWDGVMDLIVEELLNQVG